LLQARVKKGGNGDRVAKAAVEETLDEERGEVEGAGQLAGEERVGGRKGPAVLHRRVNDK
jgi:hypothetical protein